MFSSTKFAGGLGERSILTMPILIGGVPRDELLARVEVVRSVHPYAGGIVQNDAFNTLAKPETAILGNLSPAELDFTGNPTTDVFLNKKRLAEWSRVNLDGYIVEFCPAEIGPHFAIQYTDQPKGEVLRVAMEGIPVSGAGTGIFQVRRNEAGKSWLYYEWAYPLERWKRDSRFLFRLREVSAPAS